MRLLITLGVLLAVVTLSVYWQVGGHDFVNLDDPAYVYINPNVATGLNAENIAWAFTSVHASNWHPLTWLSHMLDVQLFGMNPGAHHLVNVVIHIATTLLLFALLCRLTGAIWRSAFVAALFALHPVHVESVAWVAERKDVLSAFFWMLTLYVYAEYVKRQRSRLYGLAIFSFALGVMAKPMLVTLPLIMLLFDVWPLDRYGLQRRSLGERRPIDLALLKSLIKEKVPFIALTLFSCVMTIYAQNKTGTIKGVDTFSLWARIENASTAYVKYIVKMLWPTDLAIFYPINLSISLWQFCFSLLFLLAASLAVVVTVRRYPYLLTGWFWFIITLVPVIGLIQVGSQAMADRYTYIPLIGLFVIVAWGVPDMVYKLPYRQVLLASLAFIVVATSTLLTWRQVGHWRDSITLYKHTIRVTPGNPFIHRLLGFALVDKGQYDEAIKQFQSALEFYPDHVDTHYNLGFAMMKKGSLDQAVKEFVMVLEVSPDHVRARNALGRVLAAQGYYDDAIRQLQTAIEMDPNYLPAQESLRLVIQIRDAEIEDRRMRSRPE